MGKALFITGTGTDIGKTYVTGLIVKKLREAGLDGGYYKAALSGAIPDEAGHLLPGDALYVNDTAGLGEKMENLVTYVYREAVSPHLAAKINHLPIDFDRVKADFARAKERYGYLTMEGSGGILCCAVASGPAFEGAGISCGMPGITGAVSHAVYDRGFMLDVIGGGEAAGLCGSGLVDLAAVLLEHGVIAPGGRLLPPEEAPEHMRRYLTRDENGNGLFHLTQQVSLTAADVRNLQLAKAAVAGGIRVLLEQRHITADELESVEIAGGFGNYLKPESAVRIGMLPKGTLGKLRVMGNTALAGASMLALDGANWERLRSIPAKCRDIELSGRDDFADAFTDNLTF